MKLIPLADKVVLKMIEAEETTKTGLILASAAKEKPAIGEVIAVGPGGMVDGSEVEMTVNVGDKVVCSKYTGTEIKLGDDEFIIVRQSEIMAIVE